MKSGVEERLPLTSSICAIVGGLVASEAINEPPSPEFSSVTGAARGRVVTLPESGQRNSNRELGALPEIAPMETPWPLETKGKFPDTQPGIGVVAD